MNPDHENAIQNAQLPSREPISLASPYSRRDHTRRLMAHDTHYDVIIIGSGAGGGTLAHKLAPSGKRILILERGDYVPREIDNWSTLAVNKRGKYQTTERWRDPGGNPLHPH